MKKTATTINETVRNSIKKAIKINPKFEQLQDAEESAQLVRFNEFVAHQILDSIEVEKIIDFKVLVNSISEIDLVEYYKYILLRAKKEKQVESLINRFHDVNKLIAELDEKRSQYLWELTATTFGTELLENFAYEVFLRLFDTTPHLYPINLDGKYLNDEGLEFSFTRQSIAEAFLNFTVYDTKIAELKLKNSGVQIKVEEAHELNETNPKAKNEEKRGRKAANTNEMFSLKDISNQDQIIALNDLLIKNGYIEEVNGRFVYTNSTTKTIKKFAVIIKNLCNYGYSDSLTAKQAYLILKNDYSVITKPDTVAQAADKTALGILKINPFMGKK